MDGPDSLKQALERGFEVGEWRVEPATRVISNGSRTAYLEPRVMQLLVRLAQAGGQVVSRRELLDEVWSDVVVKEEAVSRAVSELRKALGDDSRQPRYIWTIHKSGYRLLARVATVAQSPLQAVSPARRRGAALKAAAALAVIVALAGTGWWMSSWPESLSGPATVSSPSAPLAVRTLTSYPGREIDPTTDRSGKRVVFAWNTSADGDEYDLYLRRVDTREPPIRITATPGFEGHAAFSPDGAVVAFVRESRSGPAVWTASALGGQERKLVDLEGWSYGLDWFPDGRSLVVSQAGEGGVDRLVRLFLNGADPQPLSMPDLRLAGDFKPAVSPGGDWIAFVRGDPLGHQDVYAVNVESGEERRLSRSGGRIRGVDWTPDGRSVVYSSDLGGGFGLWQASLDSKETVWLPLNGRDAYNPVVAEGGRIVFESVSYERNLWELDLAADPDSVAAVRLPVRSTREETFPALSPDGQHLAFVSNRTGQRSLWSSSVAGSVAKQLSRSGEVVTAGPIWSPDGTRIAFGVVAGGYARPLVVELTGGRARPLFDESAHSIPVAWSEDGERLYLASDRGGQWDLWSIGADGEALERLTTEGGIAAAEGEGGRVLYFTRPGDPAFYAMALTDSAGGQARVREVGRIGRGRHLPWSLANGAIYSIVRVGEGYRLARLDPATGSVTEAAAPPGLDVSPFSLSANAGRLVYCRVEESRSDLMFVDVEP